MATYGQLISFGPRFSDGRLCTLKVYHYIAGTTTLKDVYTDREKTTTDAQPSISDSNGMVHFYADGTYKFRIDGATDGVTYTTLDTIDKWSVVDQSSALSGEGAAIPSASTLVLGTDGDFFHVTGTTGPITAISGTQTSVTLVFDSTPTLANSGNLILQGGNDLTVVAGDVISFLNEGDGIWREQTRLLASNPAYSGVANPIINGQMTVWQRGTSFISTTTPANNDDTYLTDRWNLLSDGNDIVDVSKDVTSSGPGMILDVETINKKFGIAQIIESGNCERFIGRICTLSFEAQVSSVAKLDNIKAAIVAWSGTADVVTSDIVSAWGAEGVNPTLVANCTYGNTPVNLNVLTTYATYSVTAAIDAASATNIILFIWSDVTDTTLGHFLYIKNVKLELGSSATPIQFRPFQTELELCRRYYQKSFLYETTPIQNVGAFTGESEGIAGKAGAGAQQINVRFSPPLFKTPTVTTYNPAAANVHMRDYAVPGDCSGTLAVTLTANTIRLSANGNASTTVGNPIALHWSAEAEM
jgi:hypothetical protein